MSATQSPIFLAILEQLPRQLDEVVLETILAECVSSMRQPLVLSVATYSSCPYPEWVQAPTAPADEHILSTLKLQREERISLTAPAPSNASTSTNKEDRAFNSSSTPPDTEDTEATDDTIMAMSPLLPSASYQTITNIMHQLEREGQRRRQLANRLKRSRTQDTTHYDSSHLATSPCKVAQPPLITPSHCSSSVRLLPRTTPTPMASWMEEHQQTEDHASRSRSFASPDATPCSTPNSLEPKDPLSCRGTEAVDPFAVGGRTTVEQIASSGHHYCRWRNKVISAVLLLVAAASLMVRN